MCAVRCHRWNRTREQQHSRATRTEHSRATTACCIVGCVDACILLSALRCPSRSFQQHLLLLYRDLAAHHLPKWAVL